MIAVATGGPRIGTVEGEFTRLYDNVSGELAKRQISNTLLYRDLWEWYGRWSGGEMPTWQSRRVFVNNIFRELIQTIQARPAISAAMPPPPELSQAHEALRWDAFISHASEDKEDFVRPLAELLKNHGLKVWYDEFTLTVGDGLRRSIDLGLANSRFGIVVLSHDFFKKEWPQRELDGLFAREDNGDKVILPVWHKISRNEVQAYSPMLAGRIAISSAAGLEKVANELLRAIERDLGSAIVASSKPHAELVAFGPDIVCGGEILSIKQAEWHIRLDEFVTSDIGGFIRFVEKFDQTKLNDRYVILNALGDGRVLTSAPSITKEGNRYVVKCPVATSASRVAAKDLPSDFSVSPETGDMYLENGSLARVSGVASLPQKLRQCFSHMKGESMFPRDFGSRLQEYFWRYRGSPWLESMLKLDIIRLAAIPYPDEVMKRQHTPLFCVERVWSIKLLAAEPQEDRISIRLDLEINGVGRSEYEVSVLMPPMEALKIVNA